jgi:hypothetical protein
MAKQSKKKYRNVNSGQVVTDSTGRYEGVARWREIDSNGDYVKPLEERAQSIAHPDPVIQARRERAAVKRLETARSDETAPNPIGSIAATPRGIDDEEAKRRGEYDSEHRVETDVSPDAAAAEAGEQARKDAAKEQKRIELAEAEKLREENVKKAAAAEAEYKTTGVNPDVTASVERQKAALDDVNTGPGAFAGPGGDKVDVDADGKAPGHPGDVEGPSDSWTVPQLTDYAKAHSINLHGASNKKDVLAAVKKGDKS